MVGRKMHPPMDVHIPIPGIYEYVTLYGKGEFRLQTELRFLIG